MNTIASLFAYKTWADTELFGLLERVATQLPPDTLQAAIRTLNHIHVVDRIFRAHLAGEPPAFSATNTPETPAMPALRAAVAETDAWFERHAAAATPSTLQQTISFRFTDGDAGRMSREEMLLHVVTHGGYHRGNVGQMLQGAGIGAPRDLYTRFLHGDQPSRRAAT